MDKSKILNCIAICMVCTQGCSSNKSVNTITGTVIGAGLGAGIGGLAGGSKGAVIGAGTGAALGAVLGYTLEFASDDFTQTVVKDSEAWREETDTKIIKVKEITHQGKNYNQIDEAQLNVPLSSLVQRNSKHKWQLDRVAKNKLVSSINKIQKAKGRVIVLYPESASVPKEVLEELEETGAIVAKDKTISGFFSILLLRDKPEAPKIGEPAATPG